MGNKHTEASIGAQLKLQEASFRRRQSHPLKQLLKSLTAESADAVEVIVKCMASQDEKLRFSAASKLLDMQRQIAEDINKDELQRLIATVKFGDGKELEEDEVPHVDFTQLVPAT